MDSDQHEILNYCIVLRKCLDHSHAGILYLNNGEILFFKRNHCCTCISTELHGIIQSPSSYTLLVYTLFKPNVFQDYNFESVLASTKSAMISPETS